MTSTNLENILGQGIVTPFRRQGGDFAYAEGSELVRSAVKQILITIKGELRWRPNFGLDLERIRHKGINELLLEEAKTHIMDALAQEPRIEIVNIYVKQKELGSNIIEARIKWRAVTRGNQRSVVLTDVQTTEVEI
jgi:phage baseplate assembly protein W